MSPDVLLPRLRSAVAHGEVRAPAVSAWSVGMHVHHCALSMIGTARQVARSTPPPPRRRRSLLATVLLRIGRIPRGRANAIDAIRPRENVDGVELRAQLDECERLLADLEQSDSRAWFEHFVFGVLPRDQAVRFLRIHNDHHLRIIADILAASER